MSKTLSAPKQDRSKATLNRLMEAAEKLMSERPFEKITLQQLVAEAKTTTGSFYARFPDKYSMLAALFEEHIQTINEKIISTESKLLSLPPRERIEQIVDVIGASFRMRPALMRSGTLLFWNRDKNSEKLSMPMAPRSELLRGLEEALEGTATELGSRDPSTAAMFALKILLSSSRQHHLFTDESTVLKTSNVRFQNELSNMIYFYIKSGD